MKEVSIPTARLANKTWTPLVERIIEAAKNGRAVEVTKADLLNRDFNTVRMTIARQVRDRGFIFHGRTGQDGGGVLWGVPIK